MDNSGRNQWTLEAKARIRFTRTDSAWRRPETGPPVLSAPSLKASRGPFNAGKCFPQKIRTFAWPSIYPDPWPNLQKKQQLHARKKRANNTWRPARVLKKRSLPARDNSFRISPKVVQVGFLFRIGTSSPRLRSARSAEPLRL